VKSLLDERPKTVLDNKSEEHIFTRLNPYFFSFIVKFFVKQAPEQFIASKVSPKTLIPNLINIALYFILIFQEDSRSGILPTLYSLIQRVLNHINKNLEHYLINGSLDLLVNNNILKKMIASVDYDSPSNSYNNQM